MPRITRSSQAARVQAMVEPIASFYATLTKFPYLPASDIMTPPATGWPEADVADFRKLGKTDVAVEVLRRLPYIRVDENREWRLGYEDTLPIAYVKAPEADEAWTASCCRVAGLEDQADHETLWDSRLEPHGQKLDAQVVALTEGSLYGAWLLLDTEADRDAGLLWKHFSSKPIKEFFKDWEDKYNSLEWMPIQNKNGGKSGDILSQKKLGTASKDPAEIRNIFIDCGWGGAHFQKEECRKALSEWDKARGKRILAEYDELKGNRGPSIPDPLDEFSD
ncbi:hypothetical protein V500_10797 [Pseudogymnoascus sp. VKM F-4518 (FW-2643)]|nr:hypothetical protein V500_10797 [Pseudogymnoascus sp. VKM F-4518 (FW-2643)]